MPALRIRSHSTRSGNTLRTLRSIIARPSRRSWQESETADLLVLGSRGLHGFAAAGSVSERVAQQAKSSVLVIRSEATGS